MAVRNPDYLAQIYCSGQPGVKNIEIIANIPESIVLGVASEWEQRLPSTLYQAGNALGTLGEIANVAAFSTGFNGAKQSFTFQSWVNSNPMDFNLLMLFDAVDDAANDVVKPVASLMSLVLPYSTSQGKDTLWAPGPTPLKPDQGRISLRLGRLFYINSVIVVAVNPTFDTRMDKNGQPIAAQCEVQFRTIQTPGRENVESFFAGSAGGFGVTHTPSAFKLPSDNGVIVQ